MTYIYTSYMTRREYVNVFIPTEHQKLVEQAVRKLQKQMPSGMKATKGAAVVAALEQYVKQK